MNMTMRPNTKAGERFVELAERHAKDVGVRAAEHDGEGTFPVEAFEAMHTSGFMAATVPEALGGLGVTSLHDFTVGLSRLARGDASVAFACANALGVPLAFAWLSGRAAAAGNDAAAEGLNALLGAIGAGITLTTANTEAGTDVFHPLVEAKPTEGGWLLNGRKIFGTLSPIAGLFLVTCRLRRPDGTLGMGTAVLGRDTPGLCIADDWDALGMRATGSNSTSYTDCFVPDAMMTDLGVEWGEFSPEVSLGMIGANLAILGVYVGIAEEARDLVVEMAQTKTKVPFVDPIAFRAPVQRLVADMDVDLAASRAVLERVTTELDVMIAEAPPGELPLDDLATLNHQYHCARVIVNRAAIDVVDRAMSVVGGASYMSSHVLSRLWRDVRAGSFMQPGGALDVHETIGRLSLGLAP